MSDNGPTFNRSRSCHICNQTGIRVLLKAPTHDDPDYTVAICPLCDRSPSASKDEQAQRPSPPPTTDGP